MLSEEQWYEAMRNELIEPPVSLVRGVRQMAKGKKLCEVNSEEESLVAVVLGVNALMVMVIGYFVMSRWIFPSYQMCFMILLSGLIYMPCLVYVLAKFSVWNSHMRKENV